MRRLFNMLAFLLIFLLIITVFIVIYNVKITNIPPKEITYQTLVLLRRLLPVLLAAALLFGLIFSDSNNRQNSLLSILIFMILAISFYVFMAEILTPQVWAKLEQQKTLAHFKQKKPPVKKDISGRNFRLKEFDFTKYYPSRKNVVFKSDNHIFFISRLTRINNISYLRRIRIFSYDKHNRLEYTIFADYAKQISQEIFLYQPTYTKYNVIGRETKVRHFEKNRSIPLYYEINAIWSFPNDQDIREFNLFSALAYGDYLVNSGVRFINLGNRIYNKIIALISLLILLITAAAAGQSFELQRDFTLKDSAGILSLFIVAPLVLLLIQTFLIQIFNFIYSLIL